MRKSRGFTLIELLVVIAIIAILAAILFPVFARAKESSKRTRCMSNLRTIHQALQMYADDRDGYIPIVQEWSTPGDFTKQKYGFGALYAYTKNDGVFLCSNSTTKSAMPPYKVAVDLTGRKWIDASYHFWPHLYSVKPYPSPARLDVNLNNTELGLYRSGFSAKIIEDAKRIGGPLVDCFLHNYDSSQVAGKGVLVLTIKGNVKFMPCDDYPWN